MEAVPGSSPHFKLLFYGYQTVLSETLPVVSGNCDSAHFHSAYIGKQEEWD